MSGGSGGREAARVTGPGPHPLAGLDLAIFDKDGTLVEFELMWAGWVRDLADRLAEANDGRRLDDVVHDVMGVDILTGRVYPHGGLAATPMSRLREALVEAIGEAGVAIGEASGIVDEAWHAPDPVVLAQPIADLAALFAALRAAGIRIAVATSDDRAPTERTLAHLGVAGLVEAVACADDGRPVKPHPAAIHWICRTLGVPESRAAMIGDSPADLAMGRAAGAGLVVGVLTGVGDRATLTAGADLVVASVADLLPSG
ncbi:MAG TPA: HAD family hydrolase [Candidatus Limnocylindrales bacterium]|nr:HAD family hydrolase [Candidatus Limnocylindrales bacterium]